MKKISFHVPVPVETVGDLVDLFSDTAKYSVASCILEKLTQDQMSALENAFFEECTQGHGIIASADDLKDAVADLDLSEYANINLDEIQKKVRETKINGIKDLNIDFEIAFDVEAMVKEKEGCLSYPDFDKDYDNF